MSRCPKCNTLLVPHTVAGRLIWACEKCGTANAPAIASPCHVEPTRGIAGKSDEQYGEEELQRILIAEATAAGYIVYQTSRRGTKGQCPKCKAFVTVYGGDGAAKGLPDLFICHTRWPAGVMVGVEVKGAKTPKSIEQKVAEARGDYRVVRSPKQFWDAIRQAEEGIRNEYEQRLQITSR